MTDRTSLNIAVAAGACAFMFANAALANNLAVTGKKLVAGGAGFAYVQADVSWDNSWKWSWTETAVMPEVTLTNWDAAWIFVKYRVATNGAPWQHASLSITNTEHKVPAQAMIKVGLSANAGGTNFGCGVFLSRRNEGGGSWTNTVKLRWNYAQDGVTSTDRLDVSVHAVEMVYVPQGSFRVGSGGTEMGTFTEGNTGAVWVSASTPSVPFAITSEDSLTISNAAGCLWGTGVIGGGNIGANAVLPSAFPKGYNAFYCMKYEVTQGEWVEFFNMLTDAQKTAHDITGKNGKNTDEVTSRNTVAWTAGNATCATPKTACNFLGWDDGMAYAAWAGLRPMTELEYEKACRGPLAPVVNEFAWGSTTINSVTNLGGTDGSGTETALPANANCCYSNPVASVQGPVRAGLFANASSSSRVQSGATYWGIMEMSGNVFERVVTVANDKGRQFTGTAGDGVLDDSGHAFYGTWPDATAEGGGARGGAFSYSTWCLYVSCRVDAAFAMPARMKTYGFRAVRQAPSVMP